MNQGKIRQSSAIILREFAFRFSSDTKLTVFIDESGERSGGDVLYTERVAPEDFCLTITDFAFKHIVQAVRSLKIKLGQSCAGKIAGLSIYRPRWDEVVYGVRLVDYAPVGAVTYSFAGNGCK
jgi:hypothetical protein